VTSVAYRSRRSYASDAPNGGRDVPGLIDGVLVLMRMLVFALALVLTVVSFQSYRRRQSTRLQYAFIGFAFLSMGVGLTTLRSQVSAYVTLFSIVETIPFIIGFGMLYASLYQ
jgi:heme A synthase